jgi:hypothetical protein
MADFLTRLAEKAMGVSKTVQPLIRPMFSSDIPFVNIPQFSAGPGAAYTEERQLDLENAPPPQPSMPAPQKNSQHGKTMRIEKRPETVVASDVIPENVGTDIGSTVANEERTLHGFSNPPERIEYPDTPYPDNSYSRAQKNEEITVQNETFLNKNNKTLDSCHDTPSKPGLSDIIKEQSHKIPVNKHVEYAGAAGHIVIPSKSVIQHDVTRHVHIEELKPREHRVIQEQKPVPPPVHITIGRIDVRAVTLSNQVASPRAQKPPLTSLDEYLRKRNGGA